MLDSRILLAGPRGRRLLLAFALASERAYQPDYSLWTLHAAVSFASYHLDPGRGVSRKLAFFGADEAELPSIAPEDVAMALTEVPLAETTPERLRDVLIQAVDNAMYWQEPDGEDVLAATGPVRSALVRVAEHIADDQHASWWDSGLHREAQWAVQWTDEPVPLRTESAAGILDSWRARISLREERALRERPPDPAANYSGEWWSIPPFGLPRSSRTLFDGTPAGLWFVEDSAGEEFAMTIPVAVPTHASVFEITGAEAWADLCRRFPLDVSGEKRHDWYRTTGRAGRWVMPDWSAVARHYQGIHLTVAGYLEAAGRAIDVDTDTASVIAGWNPDETWWFVNLEHAGEPESWVRRSRDEFGLVPDIGYLWTKKTVRAGET